LAEWAVDGWTQCKNAHFQAIPQSTPSDILDEYDHMNQQNPPFSILHVEQFEGSRIFRTVSNPCSPIIELKNPTTKYSYKM
jgi:hypothetical protein